MADKFIIDSPVLNSPFSKPIATYLAGVGIYTPTTAAEADAANPTFLEGKGKGVIKILPLTSEGGKGTEHLFWAEDVQVTKSLPLKTQPTLNNENAGVSTENGTSGTESESSSGSNQGVEASQDPFIKIKFKISVTQKGLTKQQFMKKRATWLRDIENSPVEVSSEMFDTMKRMQITSLGYTIPQGEENAYYEVELTEIVESTDEQYKPTNTTPTSNPNAASNYQDGGDYWRNYVPGNSTTNSTSRSNSTN
jgi:hypothetical protein